MDAIDIAADVIRERDRLKERVRELEQMWNEMKEGHEQETDMVIMLTKRIAKAKAILEDYFKCQGRPIEIQRALDALEGK